MPIDRELFKACVNILVPYVESPADREALLQRALHGSKVIDQIDCTGNPRTFATNLVNRLERFDGVSSLITLLETLRDEVGEPTKSEIAQIIASLTPPSTAQAVGVSAALARMYVFISYAHQDRAFVDRLRGDFADRSIPYWIDKEGLTPGTRNWERAIRAAIKDCLAVVWVVSPAAYASDYVDSEIAVAETYQKDIYPVWANGDQWIDCVPLGYARAQYVDMRGPAYIQGLEDLVAALQGRGHIPPVPREPTPSLASGQTPANPYKGLLAFQEEDADKFFGREKLVARLIERLAGQLRAGKPRFLAALGPSGSGKSSVMMAGLLPALKKGGVPGSAEWTYLPRIVPGQHPLEHLTDALGEKLARPLSAIQTDLSEPGGRMLHRLTRQLPGERVVLYIDQFEELFALTQDESEREQFISLITHAVSEPDGKLIVLLSMRADFLDRPLNYPALGSLFNGYSELVQPLSIAELRDAIEKPARLPGVGLTFDPGLVAEIIFALRSRDQALAGALPLLQFTLERLYEARDGTRLTWDAYQAMGGVEGAIGTHCAAVFDTLPQAVQDQLGRVFLPLVNIDEESGEPTRRRAPLTHLPDDLNAQALIDALVKNCLLQSGRDGDTVYLKIAHEALFRSWARLADWITRTRSDLAVLKDMRKAARAWDEHGRKRDFLWLGERSQELQQVLDRLGVREELNEVERAFARPEPEHLLDEIADIETVHPRRSEIGTRLHQLKYTIPGAGLREDGLPDIAWCYVDMPEDLRAKKIAFEDEDGKVYIQTTLEPFYIAKYLITYVQFQAFVEQDYHNPAWWRGMPEQFQRQAVAETQERYTNFPRDSVSWYQAVAFCRWLTFRLPAEAWPREALTPWPLPEGEGEKDAGVRGEGEKYREMARQTMVKVARELRKHQTDAESLLWECLRDRRLAGSKFRRQHPVAETAYVVDFFCYEGKLIVEVDGPIHADQRHADLERQKHLESLGYRVLRFTNEQVFNDLETVLSQIAVALIPQPLLPQGEGKSVLLPEGEGYRVRADWQIRLPTEWEWQWAAQNGLERRLYPWPGDWDSRRCNTNKAGIWRSTAVGMYPHGAAACGALDMAGNLWELCLNKYDAPTVTAVDASGDLRGLRGGSWGSGLGGFQYDARAAYRGRFVPSLRDVDLGFRVVCARPPSL